ncbi:MAG: hypothetical protein B7Z53_04565 [Rhodospirillales bacterium 12-71-4]|nr:MAG: hypothetical protein B7Z53_04565 [Rhodospirillales bacterium 12-71-4]
MARQGGHDQDGRIQRELAGPSHVGHVAVELDEARPGAFPDHGRPDTHIDLTDLEATAVFPAHLTQVMMLAAWAAVDALPRGGVIRLGGDVEGGLSVWPDGAGAAWPAGLTAGLAGESVPLTARDVAVPLLLAVAASAGVRLDMMMGGAGGAAPLMLTLATRN